MATPSGNTNEHNRAECEDAAAIERDKYEERAAILEYDANLPRAWAEHFARLEADGPPGDFSPTRWQAALDGALIFADKWAAETHRLGWAYPRCLGCIRPRPPPASIAGASHGLLGDGSGVIAMDRSGAEIGTAGGGREKIYARFLPKPKRASCRKRERPMKIRI